MLQLTSKSIHQNQHNTHSWRKATSALALSVTAFAPVTLSYAADKPAPNVVVFFADDMGIGDTSAYQDLTGNANKDQIHTPNMQRLADRGIRFTDAHTAEAVSAPSRLSLLQGVYSFRTPNRIGATSTRKQSMFYGERQTLASMLKRGGYGTYGVGKWHVGMQMEEGGEGKVYEGPVQAGFDHFTGTPNNFGHTNDWAGILKDNKVMRYDANGNLVNMDDPNAVEWTDEDPQNSSDPFNSIAKIQQTNLDAAQEYLSDHVTNKADNPFFLYYASPANHRPYIHGGELDGVPVDGRNMNGERILGELDPNTNTPTGIYADAYQSKHDKKQWAEELTIENGVVKDTSISQRADMVYENDIIMGKLLDYLENTDDPRNPGHKLIDNTLVVFTSDNGSAVDTEPMVGSLPDANGETSPLSGRKHSELEGGTRVPFIAAWGDNFSSGETSDELFGTTDMYATIASAAGVELNDTEAVDSENVLGYFTGNAEDGTRTKGLLYKDDGNIIIRRGNLKLIATDPDYVKSNKDKYNPEIDFADLEVIGVYDLDNDIDESNNLMSTGSATQQALYADMLQTLETYVAQGYTRNGAIPMSNGANFVGGNLLDTNNWFSHFNESGGNLPILTKDAPNFIFKDGIVDIDAITIETSKFEDKAVKNAWFIQRNGTITFDNDDNVSDSFFNVKYQLEGGTINHNESRLLLNDNSEFILDGGYLYMPEQSLRLRRDSNKFLILSGVAEASDLWLSYGDNHGGTGSKVVEFGIGDGVLILTGSEDIIHIDADLDPTNDFINFVAGSNGKLISKLTAQDFLELFQSNHLRFDGMYDDQLTGEFSDYFNVEYIDDGFTVLSITALPEPTTLAFTIPTLAITTLKRTRKND
ncbi:sulfatase-like hydrolase/transferase [Planctomycetota bacterium]|nr:sulfatase-like hydrolase/transferase [Planctomycetota bacterium]